MKIIATGDWHADAYTAGVRRYEDVENAVAATVKAVYDRQADVYLFLGDLADPEVGAFQSIKLAIETFVHMRAKTVSYWLVGNHDVVEDGFGTHTLLPLDGAGANVIDTPSIVTVADVSFLFFPYVSTARAYNPIESVNVFRKAIHATRKVVVVSHLMIEGITPGSETTDMARGRDVFLPVQDLVEKFPGCVIVNGHYHTSQTFQFPLVNGEHHPIHIPGSLIRLTKGEVGNVPGYLVLDV